MERAVSYRHDLTDGEYARRRSARYREGTGLVEWKSVDQVLDRWRLTDAGDRHCGSEAAARHACYPVR